MAKDDAGPQAKSGVPGQRGGGPGDGGPQADGQRPGVPHAREGKSAQPGGASRSGKPVDLKKPAPGSSTGAGATSKPDATSKSDATSKAAPPAVAAATPAVAPAPVSLTKPPAEPPAPPAAKGRKHGVPFALFKITAALTAVGVAALTLPAGWFSARAWNAVAMVAGVDPPVETVENRSVLLTADGEQFATFYRENRRDVPLTEVAPVMRNAMLAAEDERFYDHGPIDTKGILRALVTNARGGVRQGASTITQQYVKNLAIAEADGDPDKMADATAPTMARKIREFRQALEVERRYTKDEILERYLNVTYFGSGAYGVEAAARRYFSATAGTLTLPQAAMIAGLAKSPTADAPTTDPEAARERRNIVLTRMVSAGMIERAEADRVAAQPLNLNLAAAPYGCQDSPFPFFCDYVVAELRNSSALGRTPEERIDRLLSGGLRIRTTLDVKVQRAAQQAVVEHIAKKHDIGAAIAMVEPGTGAVKAIALNRWWGEGDGATQLNYATDKNQGGSAGFQGGSTFKPFVLAVALRKGIKPSKEFDAPSFVSVEGFEKCDPDPHEDPFHKPYGVGNYEDESFGRIDMREATARSVNTYFLQLEKETGACKPPRLAEKMGLRRADGRPLDRFPSFVLGAQEVSPLRMAEAYATLAANGMHCPSYGVLEVKALDGTQVGPPVPNCERVMSEEVARGVTKLLRGVIMGGIENRTGAKMDIGRPAAGKTGTTNGARAVWFVGYTPDLAAAVWAGYPARSKPLKDVEIKGKHYDVLYGGALPGPIWKQAMKDAHEGTPKRKLLP